MFCGDKPACRGMSRVVAYGTTGARWSPAKISTTVSSASFRAAGIHIMLRTAERLRRATIVAHDSSLTKNRRDRIALDKNKLEAILSFR